MPSPSTPARHLLRTLRLALFAFGLISLLQAQRDTGTLTDWDFWPEPAPTATQGDTHGLPPADAVWAPVTVPHVFRQAGLTDDQAGWYRVRIVFSDTKSKRHLLRLEGAASVAEVWVNGTRVGNHRGAFTAAVFDLSDSLRTGKNELLVRVGNREDENQDCLSRSNLYYTPGGLYRPVQLISTGIVSFVPEFGSEGVYVTPGMPGNDGKAPVDVEAVVRNSSAQTQKVQIRHRLSDASGKALTVFGEMKTLAPGETARVKSSNFVLKPALWGLHQPKLYTVESSIRLADTNLDQVVSHIGFRHIELRDGRFFLNGSEILLRGVNKHHQNEWNWNALTETELRQEWQWMDDMGVNTVRLAHYPHSSLEYDEADRRGLAVWAENGLSGQAWKKLAHEENTVTPDGERVTREMVRQNWNHPSILIWSSGNETVVDVAAHYADLIRSEDHNRLVTFAANSDAPKNCDFDSYNTYDGWYGGHYSAYAEVPRNAFVSETGAGSWASHHLPFGTLRWDVDHFESEEYQQLFTEFRLQEACRLHPSSHPMLLWWNFREFYDTKFKKNRNTKGIVTLGGARKDIYFLYQSFLAPQKPSLHLCGSNHFLRSFAPDNGVKAYGNAASAELFINGRSAGTVHNGDYRLPDSQRKTKEASVNVPGIPVNNVFFWKTPLTPGRNVLEVRDSNGKTDTTIVYQTAPDGSVPADAADPIEDLRSSNPANPAVFIRRPVLAQTPFYSQVDGSSDNTFDALPPSLTGASWITTRRISQKELATTVSFRLRRQATVFVIFSLGTRPPVALGTSSADTQAQAATQSSRLQAAGFKPTTEKIVWRDHDLILENAALWARPCSPGDSLSLDESLLDSLILIKE